MRSFEVKVNRKARRAACAEALSDHAGAGTLAVLGGISFEAPSTRSALGLLDGWGQDRSHARRRDGRGALVKSFRNIEKVLVTVPAELEVASLVWARSVLVSEAALPLVLGRAGAGPAEEGAMSLHPNQVLLAPVVSEKSYSLITDRRHIPRHEDAHKVQVRQRLSRSSSTCRSRA